MSVEAEDGVLFDATSVRAEEIRKDAGYAGSRVLITAEIAKARCRTQIDIDSAMQLLQARSIPSIRF